MGQATFDELLDAIEHLPADEQADLLDIVRRRLAERGRRRIVAEVKQGEADFAAGTTKSTTAAELIRELEP